MKTFTGKIISTKMNGVAIVEVERFQAHPMYHKRIRLTKKYHVQNPNSAKNGDNVKIAECRPTSKLTHFKIISTTK